MENNITELVFILDRSGSMSGLEADTTGGFNSLIEKQKKEPGAAYVTTVLFDTHIDRVHDRLPLEKVPKLTDKEYSPRGCTALLDAVGSTVKHIAAIHRYARPEDVPQRTVFFITTDGMENSSRHFSADEVKKLIEHEKQKYGWEFIFLAANIDTVETANRLGIDEDFAVSSFADSRGVSLAFEAAGNAMSEARNNRPIARASLWRGKIDADFNSRSK